MAAEQRAAPLPRRLIVHAGYHKVATIWFLCILRKLADRLGLVFHRGSQTRLPPNAGIFHQENSNLDLARLPPHVGSHIIRDPRDVAISGFHFHLICDEASVLRPRTNLGNRSYQEHLRSLEPEEGLLFEMRHRALHTYRKMMRWDYDRNGFLELKYEDLIARPDETFDSIFKHYGLNDEETAIAFECAEACSFQRRSGRRIGEVKDGEHLRSGKPGQWRDEFGPRHVQAAKRLYGEGLKRFGYETDDDWTL